MRKGISALIMCASFACKQQPQQTTTSTPTSGGGPTTSAPSSPATSAAPVQTVADALVDPSTHGAPMQVPFILWGGESALFHANGGLKTAQGSIYDKLGLNIHLVPGDNFSGAGGQVEQYLAGRTPFLRGTFRMIALAAEKLAASPGSEPHFLFQMTNSRGDHLVAREGIKSIKDLRGKTVAVQEGGPHIGMLDDILRTAGLKWSDIRVVLVPDITGPNGPAAKFRSDQSVHAAFAVTPDMIGLCGGLGQAGSGAEGTVRGARVIDSTSYRPDSIKDFFAVRKDFWDSNRAWAEKFTAGYLQGVEQVVEMKRAKTPEYTRLLTQMVAVYTPEVLPNADEADGLVSDCEFVGHPGNVTFFTDDKDPHRFDVFAERSAALAMAQKHWSRRHTLHPSPINWDSPVIKGGLQKTAIVAQERFKAEVVRGEIEKLQESGALGANTVFSSTIYFEPNQDAFTEAKYGADFQQAIQLAQEYRGAALAVRGHADPTLVLRGLVLACQQKGVLQVSGDGANRRYSLRGRPLNLQSTAEVVSLIKGGACDGAAENPRKLFQDAQGLSLRRAEAVRQSLLAYARKHKLKLDESQIQPQGVGVLEPFVARPRNTDEALQNMRVEFRIVGVSVEATNPSDFDF